MVLVAALAVTAVTVNVAQAADPTVVCLNSATATLVVQVPYQGGSADLSDAAPAAFIEANAATAPGGLFYAGLPGPRGGQRLVPVRPRGPG